jgi:hypothetical protein
MKATNSWAKVIAPSVYTDKGALQMASLWSPSLGIAMPAFFVWRLDIWMFTGNHGTYLILPGPTWIDTIENIKYTTLPAV